MLTNSFSSKKALIIGSGVGGLSTAIILAKLGFQVHVIEKNHLPGGLMRSYTRDGIECSVGVHYLGSLGDGQILRRLFDFLGVTSRIPVERMGRDGIIDKYIFDDFTFDLPEGFDLYEKNLRSAFPGEQRQITWIMKSLRHGAEKMHSLDFLFSTQNGFSTLEQSKPLGEILAELRCSPGLRGVLGVPCCWIGVPLEECPSFYHNTALATYLFSSWRLKCSGAEMANAFVERLKSLGGKIIQGKEVEKVLVNSRRVEGIQLKSGKILRAPIVVGAVHPKIVLNMLPEGAVRPSYRKRISQLEDTCGIFCVHAKVDASSHKEISYNIFKLDTDKNGNIADMRFHQLRKSERAGENILSILRSSKSELWRQWEGTRSGHRSSDYVETKEKEARRLINEAKEIFGPLQDIELLDVYTPLTIRDWVNSPGGSAYGVLRSSKQLLSAALLNRTSVKGLFLAGQSVLAPGIIGTIIGSLSTVKSIIGSEQFRKTISL
jgi:phytoene dehydrogenase-like protein